MLGAVQGATEFLPVSSTAHLIVVPALLRWTDPFLNSLTFDVALHLGTLVALLAAFGGTWLRLALALRTPRSADGRLAWGLVVGTLPAVAAGATLEHAVERAMRGPLPVACWMAAGGALLWWADARSRGGRAAASVGPREAFLIGCAQALAILPGFSRSGATITAALLLGLSRVEAARYSFLLSGPVILAACVWQLRHAAAIPAGELAPLTAGIVLAGAVGALAIRGLLALLRRARYGPFAAYRLALAAVLAAWRPEAVT